MKISVVHNVFRYNPYIAESLELNLLALEKSQVPYQYIVFNDHGDESIFEDIKELVKKYNIEYIYSDINYGLRKNRGGWHGTVNYISGDILHFTDQDDVMTSLFYEYVYNTFLNNKQFKFFTANAFMTNEDLSLYGLGFLPGLLYNTPEHVKKSLRHCLGLKHSNSNITVDKLYNPFLSSGTVYKKEVHDLIGLPDVETFGGICDFEYWIRMLYNGFMGEYIDRPLWYFRFSQYTTGNEIIEGHKNRGYWTDTANKLLVEKYTLLINQHKEKF